MLGGLLGGAGGADDDADVLAKSSGLLDDAVTSSSAFSAFTPRDPKSKSSLPESSSASCGK